jgi:antitoxin component YwqK of YwqJK toxin-antitoxin module
MKRFTLLLLVAILLTGSIAFAEPKLTIHMPEISTKMTEAEMAQMKAAAEEAFPKALARIVDFVGTEKVLDNFTDMHLLFRDPTIGKGGHYWGLSRRYARWSTVDIRPSKARQNITLVFAPFSTGVANMEHIMTHEFLHVLYELQYTFDEASDIPEYVSEGIAYYGGGDTVAFLDNMLGGSPKFDAYYVVESNRYDRLRYVSFLFCFERIYGVDARKQVLQKMLKGQNYKKVFESVSGDKWKEIKKKCKQALQAYIQDRLDKSGDYYSVHQAWKDAITPDDYRQLIQSCEAFLAENSDSVWIDDIHWIIADSIESQAKYADAAEYFEKIRTGKVGRGDYYKGAAKRKIYNLSYAYECEQAKTTRADFERLYPIFWKGWKKRLDKAMEENCDLRKGGREGMRRYSYDNAKKRAEGEIRDGLRTGPWNYWHKNGQKKSEGNWIAGKRIGRWTWWHDTGNKSSEGEYLDGKQVGSWSYWHPNGKAEGTGEYSVGKKAGPYTWFHDNGNRSSEGVYKDEEREGPWTFWHENGQLKSTGGFIEGERTGPTTFFHDNGNKKSEGAFVVLNHDDKKDGPWAYWYYDGKKKSEGTFVKDKKDGPWIFWHENGNKKSEGSFKMGRKDGKWKYYYLAGPLEKDVEYEDGVKKKKKK